MTEEETTPIYLDPLSHPHSGVPGFDNSEARHSQQKEVKRKETWYTVHPGIDFRTGRFGSDAGAYAGTIDSDTPIRVISTSKPINGIVSVNAEFKIGDELKRGWFNMDDIRAHVKKK